MALAAAAARAAVTLGDGLAPDAPIATGHGRIAARRAVNHGRAAGCAGPQGAQLVLVEKDPSRPKGLRIAAQGAALGIAHRWMSPAIQGNHWLAVHTPHIGGVLHHYRRQGDSLVATRVMDGISNHRIGSRTLDQSAWQGQRLWLPTQAGRSVRVIDFSNGAQLVAELPLPARVTRLLALRTPANDVVALLDDGSVYGAA
jgi:hypothetical protein